jgi:hypothetical protein
MTSLDHQMRWTGEPLLQHVLGTHSSMLHTQRFTKKQGQPVHADGFTTCTAYSPRCSHCAAASMVWLTLCFAPLPGPPTSRTAAALRGRPPAAPRLTAPWCALWTWAAALAACSSSEWRTGKDAMRSWPQDPPPPPCSSSQCLTPPLLVMVYPAHYASCCHTWLMSSDTARLAQQQLDPHVGMCHYRLGATSTS